MSLPIKPYRYSRVNAVPASLRIVFQRDGEPDDILIITPVETGTEFKVVFIQNTVVNRTETFVNHSDLNRYLHYLFIPMKYDLQRCKFVQIDVPSYSSTIIKIQDLEDYLSTVFFSQLRLLHNYWPYEIIGTDRLPPIQETQEPLEQQEEEEEPTLFACNRRVTRSQTRAASSH